MPSKFLALDILMCNICSVLSQEERSFLIEAIEIFISFEVPGDGGGVKNCFIRFLSQEINVHRFHQQPLLNTVLVPYSDRHSPR